MGIPVIHALDKGYEPLRSWPRAIEGAVGTLTGYPAGRAGSLG
jgi:hypothetical protein